MWEPLAVTLTQPGYKDLHPSGPGVSPTLCLDVCVFADGGFSMAMLCRVSMALRIYYFYGGVGAVWAKNVGQALHAAYYLFHHGLATPGPQFSFTVKWDDTFRSTVRKRTEKNGFRRIS